MAFKIIQPAYIDPAAEIADEVYIGPFCVIGAGVKIGRGTRLENNVTIMGRVTIGEENRLFPNVVLGAEPQDVSYRGSETRVEIGDRNILREGVTINRASEKEEGVTSLGNDNFLMANCHVAHDCRLGNNILIANGTLLGGHVHVHDHAALSGAAAVHHYVTLGSYSFTAGISRVIQDVPPYMLAEGTPARPRCVNNVALKRNNFSREAIHALHEAHRLLYRNVLGIEATRSQLSERGLLTVEVLRLLDFLSNSHTGHHGRSHDRRHAA